jgi:geranylgeranyl pyrophosphate synthase
LEPLAAELEQVERKLREPVHPQYPQLGAVLQHLLESGGKRLRPALALLAGRIYGADIGKLVSLAAAVEMLHTATLVHDDLIDGALLRRGNATLNASWSPGATVLTGDFLFARSAGLAAETQNVRVITIFANTLMAICSGELRQLFERHTLPELGGEEAWQTALKRYDQRIDAKTASLFAAATEAAAVLGSAPEGQTIALRAYGHYLGLGFQIIDDVLDIAGDEATLGKPVGSDLREGIITLPVLHYLRAHPEDERIATILRDTPDDALVRDVVSSIRRSGAVDYALERAHTFIAQSKAALLAIPSCPPREALSALADYTASRKK